jgi:hypothetical protein
LEHVTNTLVTRTNQAFRWIPVLFLTLGACSLAWNQYGSISARDWLPYAVATALVAAGLFASGLLERPPRAAVVSAALLLGLAGWDALSLRWSPVPQLARDEALLVVFYALAFIVPVVLLRGARDRLAATASVAALLVALAVAALVDLLLVADPGEHYEHGRLTFPVSYVNAQAALLFIVFWPCVALAAERRRHPALRGAAMGGAAILLAGGLMTQSKGGIVALVLAGVVFFALSPARLAALVPALLPLALVGGSYELLTRPFRARFDADFASEIRFAAATALILGAAAAAAGCVYAIADRRVTLGAATRRLAGRAVLLAALVAALGATVAFFVAVDRPGHFVEQRWHSFKRIPARESGSSHLTSLGSNRYDFWRVELRLARDHPLAGVGARGFGQRYLAQRKSSETPARGHSLELDTLAETGVIGLILLCGAVGLPLARALARARVDPVVAGVAAAAVYGVVHASGDWVWTFPAVGVVLFLLLGIANSGDGERGPMQARTAALGAAAALALALVAFAPPWISARLTTYAVRHPAQAEGEFRWARRLDPLSVDPWLAEASIARGPVAAIAALREATRQEPGVSGLRYDLGVAYLRAGRKPEARRELAIAHALDPHDASVSKALRRASG